jgi:hypothetical protein
VCEKERKESSRLICVFEATMVYFEQHVLLPAETRGYVSMLIFVLLLLGLAIGFVGVMFYRLSNVVARQNELMARGYGVQEGKVDRKKD